jgi:hypothetical protein
VVNVLGFRLLGFRESEFIFLGLGFRVCMSRDYGLKV